MCRRLKNIKMGSRRVAMCPKPIEIAGEKRETERELNYHSVSLFDSTQERLHLH